MKNICSEKSLMIVMFKFSKLGSKNYKIFSVSRTSFHLTSFWLAAGAPGLTATRRWKCRRCRRRGDGCQAAVCRFLDCYIISPNARSVPDGAVAVAEVWRRLGCWVPHFCTIFHIPRPGSFNGWAVAQWAASRMATAPRCLVGDVLFHGS